MSTGVAVEITVEVAVEIVGRIKFDLDCGSGDL